MKNEFFGIPKRKRSRQNEKREKRKTKKERQESKEVKEIQEGFPTIFVIVSHYRLRRAERWENIPRVSCEVGEISVSL